MWKNITTKSFPHLDKDPIRQFGRWFREASRHRQIKLPEACCLATIGQAGFPEGRMVLLKGFDPRGFTFYTNLNSPKSRSIKKFPKASLTFYWEPLRRQVRLVGTVTPVTPSEADAYFQSRPRASQIAAWASDQSQVLSSRGELLRRYKALERKFADQKVPKPPFWSGYRIHPNRIEFWIERPSRLHDRFLYSKTTKGWGMKRLYP